MPGAFPTDSDPGPGEGIFFREWPPPGRSPRGAFLLLHGMESHSGWFEGLAGRLAAAGWAVLAPDRPGWGRSPGPPGHLASYRDFVEQTSAFASRAREKYGPVHLAGMSWGGLAALYLALRRGWLFDSLALLAPGLALRRDFGPAGRLRLAAALLARRPGTPVEPLFRPADFTGIPEWRRFIETDPLRARKVDASFCLETLKMRRFVRTRAGRRRLPPGICLLAGRDGIVDNRAAGELCRRAGLEVAVIPGVAHSLVFECPEETARRLGEGAEAAAGRRPGGRPVWLIGGGAVGSALGALLSFARVPAALLVKPGRAEAVRRGGPTLVAGAGRRRAAPGLGVAEGIGELPPDPGLVILAVKRFDLAAALAGLRGKIPGDAVVAGPQNGIGAEAGIAEAFPGRPVAAVSLCAGLESASPGLVAMPGDRGGLAAAAYRGDPGRAEAAFLAGLAPAGLECRWLAGPRAAERLKWSKLLLSAGLNALAALGGLSSAGVLRHREYGSLAVRAMREGLAVMRADSLAPVNLPGYPTAALAALLRAPVFLARALLAARPAPEREAAFSLRRDFLRHPGRSEIDYLNGAVVRAGRELNVPTPANLEILARYRRAAEDGGGD
ncbi:MAG: alpha/beta fold hydrolase [Planctomycetota bacterium]|nr:alpha/beta fold hydrolase [Planctomycetota bacterium]